MWHSIFVLKMSIYVDSSKIDGIIVLALGEERVKEKRKILKAIAMITQIGISMMVPIFLCIFVGYKIDQQFKTQIWFLVFLILGFITAFRNVYNLTKGFYMKEKEKEDAQMNYFADLRQNNQEYKKSKTHKKNKQP